MRAKLPNTSPQKSLVELSEKTVLPILRTKFVMHKSMYFIKKNHAEVTEPFLKIYLVGFHPLKHLQSSYLLGQISVNFLFLQCTKQKIQSL